MPRRLSDHGGSSEHERGGYPLRYGVPHSPFQLLLERYRVDISAARVAAGKRGYSLRAMARDLGITQSSLWIWIHNEAGYPSPKSFDARGMFNKIVKTLGIPAEKLAWALDESRKRYSDNGSLPDPTVLEAFAEFIRRLEQEPAARISKSTWLDTARRLYFSARAAALGATVTEANDNPQAPAPKPPARKKSAAKATPPAKPARKPRPGHRKTPPTS